MIGTDATQLARLPLVRRVLGKAMAQGYRLLGKHHYDDYRVERVGGLPFLVTPSVFNPKIPRTGEFFASQLDATLGRDWEVLDMGTGSGVCAVFAARCARRVVAVDINPAAVRCARINSLMNGLAPVQGERFDLILFNPPFIRGTPRDPRDGAWRSDDVAERFAAGLAAHLKPGGRALVLLSTFGDGRAFLKEFHNQGFKITVFAERRFVTERLTLFHLLPTERPG
jgi:release factor glutamine methyltransferase